MHRRKIVQTKKCDTKISKYEKCETKKCATKKSSDEKLRTKNSGRKNARRKNARRKTVTEYVARVLYTVVACVHVIPRNTVYKALRNTYVHTYTALNVCFLHGGYK